MCLHFVCVHEKHHKEKGQVNFSASPFSPAPALSKFIHLEWVIDYMFRCNLKYYRDLRELRLKKRKGKPICGTVDG